MCQFSEEVQLRILHLYADIENAIVHLQNIIESYEADILISDIEFVHCIRNLQWFLEYSTDMMDIFKLNRKYSKDNRCYCIKCTTIGYGTLFESLTNAFNSSKNLHKSLQTMESLPINEEIYIKRFAKFIECFYTTLSSYNVFSA